MASFDFEAKLTKGEITSAGMSVVWPDKKVLLIREVKPEGLAAMYNAGHADSALKIQPCDKIVAVNGIADDPEAMLKEIASSMHLDCKIQRALPQFRGGVYYYIELKKTADCKKTGLTVRWPDEKSLLIKTILEDGLVPKWIKDNPDAPMKPQVGDVIIEVNSIGGTHTKLMEMLEQTDVCKLTIFRAPTPPTEALGEQPAEPPKESAPQEESKKEFDTNENYAPEVEPVVAEPAAEPCVEPKAGAENVIGMELEAGETGAVQQKDNRCGCW